MIVVDLKNLLHDHRMSQIDLVRISTLTPHQVCRWCKSDFKHLPLDQLNEICRVLKEPVEKVLKYIPDSQ